MKELTYTLEERGDAQVMIDSEGYVVGIFSDVFEAEQAWPKIKYNLELVTHRVNLKFFTIKKFGNNTVYLKPTNSTRSQHKGRK